MGTAPTPAPIANEVRGRAQRRGDPHLRSAADVTGFTVEAADGEIGHIEDFVVADDESWAIRYAVVDTVNWWPGKKVLIVPRWFKDISWDQETVAIDLTRQQIKDGPEYLGTSTLDRGYEERLHRQYGASPYWE